MVSTPLDSGWMLLAMFGIRQLLPQIYTAASLYKRAQGVGAGTNADDWYDK